ncbi:MAG: M1 family metallopeptidase [Betaproteobacteria bacterium]
MRKLLSGLAALAWLAASPVAFSADPPAAPAVEPPTFRLPAGARPLRYAVTLTLVPGEAKVPGEIAIDVELDRPHPVLWLNADTLNVTSAAVDLPGTRVTVLSGQEQFVGVAFDPPLAAGRHRVTLAFEAEQSRNTTRGIFALQDNGAWYAMTQFEATSARRAFPCFDEPGFKTPWQLTLRVPRDVTAVSNTPIASETPGDDGLKTVRFAETRPLPTYLVAFAVGPWEFVDLGRVGVKQTPTRLIVPRGRLADTTFAAGAYPQLFERLETWFGIPYPFGKLDHIAIPLTVNFAMENAGLITYAAPGLLARPGAATPRFRRGAANVGAHEIAHQWFGNLVTTAWWDDIWLNEAFATWIAEKIANQWRPDYERGAARIGERAQAIDADALTSARQIREPVNSRGDIFNAFDSITYEKGATVIGMFEGWIGEEPFRRGVHDYLESRRDGSATAEDFFQSLTQASRLPVAPAFNTFLNHNGVPRIEVRLQCGSGGAKLALTQHRLELLGSGAGRPRQWQIPVCVRYGAGASSRESCTLMTEASKSIPLDGECPAFVFANAAGRGYYVPDYRDGLLAGLAKQRNSLTVAEYASLLHDLKVLVRAGAVSLAQAMQWVRYGAAARDRHVVLAALDLAEFLGNTLFADAGRPAYSGFVREVFGPRAKALGFVPKAGESDDDQLLRRSLLRVVAPEDPLLAAEARRLARAWIGDRKTVDPGLVDVVLVTAGRTGDAAMFDALLAEAKATQDRLDRRYLMMALFAFTDPALAQKGMALLLDPAFDVRESWTALGNGFYWNTTRRAPNDFIMANFDALAKTVGRDSPGGWPFYASGLCSDRDRADVDAFWKERAARYAGADRELAQAMEAIRVCARVRAHAGSGSSKR